MESMWLTTIFLSALLPRTAANVTLSPFPDIVSIGKKYTVSWTATTNYSYTLWLITDDNSENPYEWIEVDGLGTGLQFDTLGGNYTWTVPSNLNTTRPYSLWLDGLPIPFDGESVSTMTDWFAISSKSLSTTTSTNPSATSTQSSGIPTNSTSSNTHHKDLSGGAIAGIVIGVIVGIALIIGAILFSVWRKKRSGFKSREAAARASRLAPVMESGAHGFEMHGRDAQVLKETNP